MFKTRAMSMLLLTALVTVPGFSAGAQSSSSNSGAASHENFKHEFDEVCSKTQDSMTLSEGELIALLMRCDALVPIIAKLDDTQKKVYLKRLSQCRGLYAYVLDSKRNEKK